MACYLHHTLMTDFSSSISFVMQCLILDVELALTLLQAERPKLYTILAFLRAIRLKF